MVDELGKPLLTCCMILTLALGPGSTSRGQQSSPANESQAASTESDEEVPERVDVRNVSPDRAIEARLSGIFTTTGWFEELNIDVRQGVVFLEGMTDKIDRKEWAERLARNTESVAAVVNNIEIQSSDVVNLAATLDVVAESLQMLLRDFLQRSPLLFVGLLMLMLTWLIARLAKPIVSRLTRRLRSSLQDLILQLTTIGLWIVGVLVAAVIVFPGMTPAKILTVLGLSSVAVGFAFKDIFENFFAGILILWKYPFDKGDFVECGDIMGKIEDITIRMTMIRQVDGQLAVVPNSMLFKNAVDVLTSKPSRRISIICGVSYDADLERSREVLQSAVSSCTTVKSDEPIEIFAQEFGASSINFEVTWWTAPTPRDIRESRDEVVTAVKQALDQAGIEIPFPQRTLHFPEPLHTQSVEEVAAVDQS